MKVFSEIQSAGVAMNYSIDQAANGKAPTLEPRCGVPHQRFFPGMLAALGVCLAWGSTALASTPTTTTLGGVSSPQTYGDTTLTATVSPSGATGTVTFTDNNGSTTLGSVAYSGVTVSLTTNLSVNGGSPHAITASFHDTSGTYADSSAGPSNVTITARAVTLTGTKTYDGTATITPATGLTIANNVDGSNLYLTPTNGTATLAGKNAGAETVNLIAWTNYATPSRVQTATGTGGTWGLNTGGSFTVALTNSPADGNMLVALITTCGKANNMVTGISQNSGTVNWTYVTSADYYIGSGGYGAETEIWYATNVQSAGQSVTITVKANGSIYYSDAAAVVVEYSGVLTNGALDQKTNNYGTSATASTGTTPTTTQANELWVGGIGIAGISYYTLSGVGSGWNVANYCDKYGWAYYYDTIYALETNVTATGQASCTGTISSSAYWSGVVATFKASSSTPSLTLAGPAAANYTLSGWSGSVTIAPLPLTLTAVTATKTYDGTTNAAGTPNYSPSLISPDSVTNLSQAFATRNVGASVSIVPNIGISDGNGGNNYSVTKNNATGTINPTNLTVTAGANTKLYDGTNTAAALPTITLGNLQPGDTTNALSFWETYNNRNVGTGKTLTPAGVVSDGNYGTNYHYTYTPVTTGVINPTNLTVTAAANTKLYDGTTNAANPATITLGSIQIYDSPPLSGWTQSYADKNVGASKMLTPAVLLVQDGNYGTNYHYTYTAAAVGVIVQTNLTVTAAPNTKIYDGTTSATNTPNITAGSIQSGDTAPAWTETYDNPSPGTDKTLTPSGKVLDGNSGLNYFYDYASVTNGVITPLEIAPGGEPTNLTVCAGSPAIFTVDLGPAAGLTYQWQVFTNGGTDFQNISDTATNASYTNASTTLADNGNQYQVIVGEGTTSLTSAPPAVLTVNAGATADAGTNQTSCSTNCIALNGTVSAGATGGQWTSSGTGAFVPDDTTLNASYCPSLDDMANGTVTLTLTSTGQVEPCPAATAQVVETIITPPSASAGGNQTISCGAVTAGLGGSVGGCATDGQWTSSGTGTFSDATALNATYTPSSGDCANGAVTLTLTTTGPCALCPAATAQVVVTVNPVLAITEQPTNLTVCAGSAAVFSVKATGMGLTYQWQLSADNGTNFYNISDTETNASYTNMAAAVADSGNQYQVIVTEASYASVTSTQAVLTVITAPTASAGTNQTICAGNCTVGLGGTVGGCATGGQWTSSGTGSFTPDATTLDATYCPSASDVGQTVTLTLTSSGPCAPCPAATAQVQVTVINPPTANAGGNRTICGTNCTALGGSVGGCAAGGSWTTTGTGAFSPNADTVSASYCPSAADVAAGSVTVTLTSSGPCAPCSDATSQAVLTIITPPVASAGANQTIYAGQTTAGLGGSVGGCATGGQWTTSGTGTFVPNATALNAYYTPSTADANAGGVTLTLTSTGPCAPCAAATAQVVVTILPKITTTTTLTFANPQTYGSTVLSAAVAPSGASGTVTLSADGTNLAVLQLTNGTVSLATNLLVGGSPYAIQASFFDASGVYASSSSVSNLTVVPRVVTLTGTKTYDGGVTITPAQGLALVNNVDGANLSLTPSTGTTWLGGRNVGTEGIISIISTNPTPTRVQSTNGFKTGGTSWTLSLAKAPTNGNTLIAVVATMGDSADVVTVSSTNNAGGTQAWYRAASAYTTAPPLFGTDGAEIEIWYAPNVQNPSTNVSIAWGSLITGEAVIMEYSGLLTASPLDRTATAVGTNSSPTTGTTATTTQPNELWIGGICLQGPANPTFSSPANGFAVYDYIANWHWYGTLTYYYMSDYALDKVVTATDTAYTGGSLSASTYWAGAIATFKAASYYTYTTNLALAGSAAPNYTLSATGSVTVAPTNLTVTAAANAKTYDGTTNAAAHPTITSGSIQAGDSAPAGGWTEGYADKNVGTGKTLIPTGVVNDGNGGNNYSYTYAPVNTGEIDPTNLTVTAAANTKLYDGTSSAAAHPTVTSGSIQTGDSAPVWTETYASRNVGTGKTLNPAGVVNDGNGGANYSYTYAPVNTGEIDQTNLTVTAATNTKVYDGTTSATNQPSITAGSIQAGDSAPVWTESYDNASPGTGKTLTPAGKVNDGNNGSNYNYTYAPDATGVITPLAIAQQPTNVTVCAGSPASFSVGVGLTTGLTYQWQVSVDNGTNFTDIEAATNGIHTIGATVVGENGNQYQVIVGEGMTSLTSAPPAVLTVITPATADAGTNQTSCSTNCIALNGTVGGCAMGGQWSSSGTGTFVPDDTTLNALYCPSAADVAVAAVTLTLTTTGPCAPCPAATAQVVETINPLPTVSVNSATICVGSSVTLTATTDASNPSYLWSPGGATTQSITVTPAATTTYTVTVADGTTGCAGSGNGTVTVDALPTATTGGNQTICCGYQTAPLGGAVGGSATGGFWTSSGSGSFSPDIAATNATYVPSGADCTNSPITLTLTATGQPPTCGEATAQVVVTINICSQANVVQSVVNNHNGTFTLHMLGTPGAQYYLVSSSNVLVHMPVWTAVVGSTNTAGSDGNWSGAVSGSAPMYYRAKAVNPAP
jgi:phosphotransferase system IIB component